MTRSHTKDATFAGVILISLAFVAAYVFHDAGWFSLIPPASDAVPNPTADTDASNLLALSQSAFTAWAALILLIPAYYHYLTKGAAPAWLAYWSVAYVAYVIHIGVSAFLFFGGDFAWMTSSTRVSAFWPGMILIPWWGLDVALASARNTARWVRLQRTALHLITFVLFFGGSAIKGEGLTIQIIGGLFALTAIFAILTRRKPRGAPQP